MKSRLFLVLAACSGLLVFSSASFGSQTLITFDDLSETGSGSSIANGYQGLNWNDDFGVYNAILFTNLPPAIGGGVNGSYYGMVSVSNAAIAGFHNPAEIDSAGANFNFLSIYLTGSRSSNVNVEVQGFRNGSLLYDQIVVLAATVPIQFTFDYVDIDRLAFTSSGGDRVFGGGGSYYVLDNLTIEFIPEPSSFLLTAAGVVGLWTVTRRRRV